MTHRDQTEAGMERLERRLEALGAEERRGAPDGMADRIAKAAALTARDSDAPGVLARIGFGGVSAMRLAAAIALLVGGSVVTLLVLNNANPVQAPDGDVVASSEFETWMAALASDPTENLLETPDMDGSVVDSTDSDDDLYATFWSGSDASDSFLEDVL